MQIAYKNYPQRWRNGNKAENTCNVYVKKIKKKR